MVTNKLLIGMIFCHLVDGMPVDGGQEKTSSENVSHEFLVQTTALPELVAKTIWFQRKIHETFGGNCSVLINVLS